MVAHIVLTIFSDSRFKRYSAFFPLMGEGQPRTQQKKMSWIHLPLPTVRQR